MVVVLISVSMSMALAYAALSSQARGWQVRQNVQRQELARQAAESGAAIALHTMQSAAWSGVATPLSGTLNSDSQGTTSYSVTFLTIDGQTSPSAYPTGQGITTLSGSSAFHDSTTNGLSVSSAESAAQATRQALQVLLRVTGQWQSATDPLDLVTVSIEVGTELQPRVPGRTIIAPDIPEATDIFANNGSYDAIQTYALFASSGSSLNQSLRMRQGHCVDGPSWLTQGVSYTSTSNWSSTVRNELLQSIGSTYSQTTSGTTTFQYPHPIAGPITIVSSLTAAETTDLSRLNVPHSTASTTLTPPTVSFSDWTTYQLFQGGFTYSAHTLNGGTLDGDVLRPSASNPLGVFYRPGDLTIDDNVVIHGTLVCTGRVSFTGHNAIVASINWHDATGSPLATTSDLFPRAPAIVANEINLGSSLRASIDGAVVLTARMTGGNSSYDFLTDTDLSLSGTNATSAPIRPPYSEVSLPSNVDLSSVDDSGLHAIWLAEGNSGNWFPIIDKDSVKHRLTVLGEAKRSVPTSFRIARQRTRQFDLRGPLMASQLRLTTPSSWSLGATLWNNQHDLWLLTNQIEAANSLPLTPFVTWVASPANYNGWSNPWERAGLPLDPVVHIRPQTGIKFRDSLPLFRSYVPPANQITATNNPSGYRWRVLFWRDVL